MFMFQYVKEAKKINQLGQQRQAITLIFIENREGRGGAVGVPQSHSPVGRAGKEALVCAAVHQTPN